MGKQPGPATAAIWCRELASGRAAHYGSETKGNPIWATGQMLPLWKSGEGSGVGPRTGHAPQDLTVEMLSEGAKGVEGPPGLGIPENL